MEKDERNKRLGELQDKLQVRKHPVLSSIVSGLLAGVFFGVCSSWHNVTTGAKP